MFCELLPKRLSIALLALGLMFVSAGTFPVRALAQDPVASFALSMADSSVDPTSWDVTIRVTRTDSGAALGSAVPLTLTFTDLSGCGAPSGWAGAPWTTRTAAWSLHPRWR